jgi:acyl dehydratase
MSDTGNIRQLGQGFYFQELEVGQKFQTHRRTITETDLVSFINVTGMLEVIFLEASALEGRGGIAGRPVPAALTYSIIEGFVLQTMIQGTGMAMLELTQKVLAPVRVGDTIRAIVEVTAIRPTSKGNRAVVDSSFVVLNQHDQPVMTYTARRMLAGRPEANA